MGVPMARMANRDAGHAGHGGLADRERDARRGAPLLNTTTGPARDARPGAPGRARAVARRVRGARRSCPSTASTASACRISRAMLHLSPSGMTRRIDGDGAARASSRGGQCPTDRRGSNVVLTDAGHASYARPLRPPTCGASARTSSTGSPSASSRTSRARSRRVEIDDRAARRRLRQPLTNI